MTIGIKNPSNYYIELINSFPPRPINNEAELLATQDKINSILDKQSLTQDDKDYLRVLGMLVYEYENNNEIIPEIEGIELLQALSEELGTKNQELLNIFVKESTILDILQNKQKMTIEQERELRKHFI
ncbi:MAG: transcriptional regulator [Xenococcaceae cyanobacterium MO_188.B19]|nr:transcriptional regulator [Xenococcaceae cyanobacterium MO_188.B19]